ncbi:hypothetical protein JV173_03640 [Acholeplasma equirhinis]|uniref:phosphorylase family protein n=1 Tax=Acholeplasma equirhinis TaxID=555393 RepID=UPI00197A9346|nr:hypothetical protein [Acholeplasma equirhinis]MBN3490602.1 hypothetical protein [Acholeplasma equirhinis]
MKERMHKILEAFHKYNSQNMAQLAFGLDPNVEYDVLVVAPTYSPLRLEFDKIFKVTTLKESSYLTGYLLESEEKKIAWIKVSSSASNLIDHVALCAELKFKKMVFVGAVGALKPEIELGDICTPSYSIAGGYTHTYLKDSIKDFVPFEKVEPKKDFINEVIAKANEQNITINLKSVFSTDSVALEYIHLDEIKSFGTDLIEMETAVFYLMADLIEVDSIALLVVSDNSASGIPLVGRSVAEELKYHRARKEYLPQLLLLISNM